MWPVARRYPLVFFTGATALVLAVMCGVSTAGVIFCPMPLATALRRFGVGFMAAAGGLWLGVCREEARKPNLNHFFNLTISTGAIMLWIALFTTFMPIGPVLMWIGVGINAAALAAGLIAMLFDPAYPCPLTARWPEGGEDVPDPHAPGLLLRLPSMRAANPDDLTRITGIDRTTQRALNQAGIVSYEALAAQTAARLRNIMAEYCIDADCDPQHVIEQARLAAAGEWDRLRHMQAIGA